MTDPASFFKWLHQHTHQVHGGLVAIMLLLLAYVFYDYYRKPENRRGL